MISNTRFWLSWPKPLKNLFLLLAILFVTASAFMLYWHFNTYENVLKWNIATELLQKDIAVPAFVEKGLQFTQNEVVYYVKEWFIPSHQQMNRIPAMFLLGLTVLGVSLITGSLSFENTKWFLPAIIAAAAFLLTGRFEVLFQQTSNLPFLVAFALLGGLLFVFNAFLRKTGLLTRVLSVLLTTLAILVFATYRKNINEPLLAFTHYGLIFPIIIFSVFVFTIAHEGIGLVVWSATNSSQKGRSSFNSYLILSTFYLLNCLLIYLENVKIIDQSSFIISPVWLFLFSSIAGVWGFRKQSEDLGWFSFRQTGAWLYFGMALISVGVLAFAFASGNDPLFELLIDYIAICHLIMGLAFFVHVLINFTQLFRGGYEVDKVLYKPKFSRLILAKVAGIAAIGFLLIQKNIYSYQQLKAGLSNALGDYYLAENELTAAETYYKESIENDFYNHKGNYALAQMAFQVGDRITASYYFKRAIQKNPTEYAYAALSQNLETEDLYFESLFNLREGLQKFPQSSVLQTNMARTLEKASARDSVFIYLNQALENCGKCEVQKTNLQAFWIENAQVAKLDSVTSELKAESMSNIANQLAISRISGVNPEPLPELYKGTSPNTGEFAAFYNQLSLPQVSIELPDSVWANLVENTVGAGLNNEILFLKANQDYKNQEIISAVKQLSYLAQDSTETGVRNRRTLGLWYLNEGLYNRAVDNFRKSGDLSSVEVLEANNFRSHLLDSRLQQADELGQLEINEETYEDIYKRAPFNEFLTADIAEFLAEKGKVNEAYNLVFNALEFNDQSPLLWQKYVLLAVKNGVNDYALDGLDKLETLLPDDEFGKFYEQYEQAKKDFEAGFDPL
ncbi:tetratricopeptide repeat protein [Jiulongibacter sediminis]|uniref:Tetratricopeptide repeat protein n=1 Tax=Jiulongibacter sediminis TaxID=1605367 RepID=A0A0N8H9T1_9BACT|nr:hypothetical protein [Jiulongibacter sediminis]KPM48236.1 hypothetical protein AFM12_06130 [Jiulongibacter sediminis]TBX24778.1 hypothetical protein TK44_06135 [Jiulongibacter sediminis]